MNEERFGEWFDEQIAEFSMVFDVGDSDYFYTRLP